MTNDCVGILLLLLLFRPRRLLRRAFEKCFRAGADCREQTLSPDSPSNACPLEHNAEQSFPASNNQDDFSTDELRAELLQRIRPRDIEKGNGLRIEENPLGQVRDTDIVAPDDKNVWFLLLLLCHTTPYDVNYEPVLVLMNVIDHQDFPDN